MQNSSMRLLLIALLSSVFLGGCTQWKRLTGREEEKPIVADVHGIWGAHVTLAGVPTPVHIDLFQSGAAITNNSRVSLNYGQYGSLVAVGNVSGNTVTFTGHYTAAVCPNEWTFTGTLVDDTLNLTIHSVGNNQPGTNCYPNPVDEVVTFGHWKLL